MGYFITTMEKHMKVNGKMIKGKEKEYLNIIMGMGINMKVSLDKIKLKERENSLGKVEIIMKEILKMI